MMASGESRLDQAGNTALMLADSARAAGLWKARTGGRIIGYMGTDVPVEIIAAAGLYPVRVGLGSAGELKSAACFFERGDSEVVAQLVEPLLDGSLSFLDHLVIGNTPTNNVAVFHFLREARRRTQPSSPPITLHELHHGGDAAADNYNFDSCQRLVATMEQLGSKITGQGLGKAIAKTNKRREEAAALAERRQTDRPEVSGTAALNALTRTQLIPNDPLAISPGANPHGPRILFSGSDSSHLDHYPLIEEAGCVIVADDHDWGEQALELKVDEDGDPLAAIARRYTNRPPRSARWPMRERIEAVVDRAISARVDGVVFWISDEDHASNWDLPRLIDALHKSGIATLNLGPQPTYDVDAPAIVERTAEWLDTIARPVLSEARS